jgi:hypothetical protein
MFSILDSGGCCCRELLTLASESKIVPCIDTPGPFAFDTEGVRDAFRLQGSHHAKGKVVITVSKA